MREAVAHRLVQTDFGQRFQGAFRALGFAQLRRVGQQAFFDNGQNRHTRRERAVRILEDHLQFFAQRLQVFQRRLVNVATHIDDGAFTFGQA